MVKVGFIGEGETEQIVLESNSFQSYLKQIELHCVWPVFDAKGAGNLLPQNISTYRNELIQNGAEKIIILTDLDEDVCFTLTKQRITERSDQLIFIAAKKIEAWFLAESDLLSSLVKVHTYFEEPESYDHPFDVLQQLFLEKTGRGVGSKTILARRMIKYGFSIENAASHPHCPSANYFLTKLQSLRP
jgi:hypothetical protein